MQQNLRSFDFKLDSENWSEYHAQWDNMWQNVDNGSTLKPGQAFDKGDSPGILLELLGKGTVDVAGKRCLVPGCGRGYDPVTLVRHGAAEALGLELAQTAVKEAEAYRDSAAARLDDESRGRVHFAPGDFFAFEDPKGTGYDLAFDYTFFCAIRPDMRADWGRTYGRLVRPGGQLVCVMFPVDPARSLTVGPPFRVDLEAYEAALLPNGFTRSLYEAVHSGLSTPDRAGKEWIGIYTKN